MLRRSLPDGMRLGHLTKLSELVLLGYACYKPLWPDSSPQVSRWHPHLVPVRLVYMCGVCVYQLANVSADVSTV